MFSNNIWLSLVKHEFRWGFKLHKSSGNTTAFRWALLYSIIGIAAGIGCLTYFTLNGFFQAQYLWYSLAWVPFWILGLGHQIVGREWHHRTFGWWLTLPYSRVKLVFSKFAACFLKILVILAGMYAIVGLLAVYVMSLQNNFQLLGAFLQWGLVWYALILCLLPAILAFAMLSGVIAQSRLVAVIPLLWIVFWLVGVAVVWLVAVGDGDTTVFALMNDLSKAPSFPANLPLVVFVPIIWMISFFMIRWMAFILERSLKL